jgi:two-component system response regulator MprA
VSVTGADVTAKRRALLVDDDDDVGETFTKVLERAGFHVQRARTGTEALSMLAALDAIDAAVVDLVLPGTGGLEVVRQLRQAHPRCRIVAATGLGVPEIEEAFRAAGADVFLAKPVELSALLAAVGATLA